MVWLKLWTDIRFDEKMARLSHLEFRCWIYLLAWYKDIICSNLNSPNVDVRDTLMPSLRPAKLYRNAIRSQLGIRIDTALQILKKFAEMEMVDIVSIDHESIDIVILKWDKRQESSSARRMRALRHKQRHSDANSDAIVTGTVTPEVTGRRREEERRENNTPPKSPQGSKSVLQSAREEEAEEIYQAYPKHVGKKAAIKAILKALQEVDFGTLLSATQEYASSERVSTTEKRFIPNPSTWFNQGCWEDDRSEWNPSSSPAHEEYRPCLYDEMTDEQKELMRQEELEIEKRIQQARENGYT